MLKTKDISSLFEFLTPPLAGVYILSNKDKVLYVGRSVNARSRVSKHYRGAGGNGTSSPSKSMALAGSFDKVEFVEISDPFLQVVAEAFYIWKYDPSYNVLGRYPVSKSYSDKEAWGVIKKMASLSSKIKEKRRSI